MKNPALLTDFDTILLTDQSVVAYVFWTTLYVYLTTVTNGVVGTKWASDRD